MVVRDARAGDGARGTFDAIDGRGTCIHSRARHTAMVALPPRPTFSDDATSDDVTSDDASSAERRADANARETATRDDATSRDDDVARRRTRDARGRRGRDASDDDDANDATSYWANARIAVTEYAREDAIEIARELRALGATATER